jgi:hypothetical protein
MRGVFPGSGVVTFYSELAELAGRQAELAAAGRHDEALALADELERRRATAPPARPVDADAIGSALEATRRAQAAVEAELAAVRAELAGLARTGPAAAAYARAAGAA